MISSPPVYFALHCPGFKNDTPPDETNVIFLVCLVGFKGQYSDENLHHYLYTISKVLPGATVSFVISPFTRLPSLLSKRYNLSIKKHYYGLSNYSAFSEQFHTNEPIGWGIIRILALYDMLVKSIMPSSYRYVCISDLDNLFIRNPFEYLLKSNTTHMLHLMEDIFPLTSRYSNDANYGFYKRWWDMRKEISNYSNYTIIEPKERFGSESGANQKVALNSGTWLGRKELVYKGLKIENELFHNIPEFPYRVDQGGLNYLRISGQLFQYLPEQYWYFHSIGEGLFISCPDVLPFSSLTSFISSKSVIVHHWRHIPNYELLFRQFDL